MDLLKCVVHCDELICIDLNDIYFQFSYYFNILQVQGQTETSMFHLIKTK